MPARARRHWRRRLGLGLILLVAATTVIPVALLGFLPAWTSSFMIRYQFERLGSERPLAPLEHDWVGWDRIAPAAKIAVIAAEDQRFAEHFGFDLAAIEKAREHNERSKRIRGASTLTQQVAKNLFLWPGRSWVRKGLEVGYTLLIETFWSKRRVLEMYLNVAEFGEGVFGVEAAAQKFFHKPASRLTDQEAALLAAVLPSPRRMKVAAPSAYVETRASWIRGQMAQLGPEAISHF
ncbi:MAG: monofunctional biosynthetic peptidoglycan transglycosylase [Panacagrimonas sp.]